MGFYYEQPPPDSGDEKPGCMDAIVISRVVLQLLFWPLAVLVIIMVDFGVALYLFTIHPVLALIPVGATALAIYGLPKWDQNRDRPPDLPES